VSVDENPALLAKLAPATGAVSVTALFGTDAAHAEAERFTKFLAGKLGADLDLHVRHWSYHELQHLRVGKVAADLAEQTDILLLVTHADDVLPPAVGRWIASWLLQAGSSDAAICLVGSADAGIEAPVAHHLRNACEQTQVQFFASRFTMRGPCRPGQDALCSGAEDHFQAFGIMHWGINE
jgi:hypothetical protein